MPRVARVQQDGVLAGFLWELTRHGATRFRYTPSWLADPRAYAISPTLPLRPEPFEWPGLHPFFSNLLPEGWLLDIARRVHKVDALDQFGLLLGCCADCAGATEVHPATDEDIAALRQFDPDRE